MSTMAETAVLPLDERDLIAALRAGDERAFARLVEQYHSSLVRVARTYVRSAAVAHPGNQQPAEMMRGDRVCLHHSLELRGVRLGDRPAAASDPGVVDQDVDRPEALADRFDHGLVVGQAID